MEIERVRALKELEEREGKVRDYRRSRAVEIKSQIVERQQQRLIDNELKDQETQAMLQQLENMRVEDQEVRGCVQIG